MPRTPLVAALAATALLSLPAGALAQGSAGDNQYADPFGNAGSGSGSGSGHHVTHHAAPAPAPAPVTASSPSASSPAASSAPADSSAVTPSTTAAPAATTASGSSNATLPYTGFDAGWEAAAGGVLLLAGLALRARTRRRAR